MSSHDRKQRNAHLTPKPNVTIATPPRAALPSRHSSRASEHQSTDRTLPASSENSNTSTGTSNSPEPTNTNAEQAATPNSTNKSNVTPSTGSSSSSGGGTKLPQHSSPSVTNTTTMTEKDKDVLISQLQQEISIMTNKFATELDRQSAKIITLDETTLFWQQKHSALHQQFLKTDTETRLLRYELASREERERDIKTRVSSLLVDRDTLREAWEGAKGEVRRKEGEVIALREQVRGLKEFVSLSTRGGGQVTDEVLGERVRDLGNVLQNWVISNFRRAKIDLSRAKENTKEQLLSIVPTYESQLATSKVHFLQSLVSWLLVTHIFESYFVGLPDEKAKGIQTMETYLGSLTKDVAIVNQWRSSTLSILNKSTSEGLRDTTEAVTDTIITTINEIMNDISDARSSESRDQSLRVLINSSIDLSRLLRVQKAVFKTIMPVLEDHQINIFDPETMEDIGGEDETTLAGREIRCVTFPGIVKEGDESGEQTQLRNVISKARVLCSPD